MRLRMKLNTENKKKYREFKEMYRKTEDMGTVINDRVVPIKSSEFTGESLSNKTVKRCIIFILILLVSLMVIGSGTAEANWSKNDNCIQCHTNVYSGAVINVAVDGVETTSASIDNNGTDSIELDWMFEGGNWTSYKESVGVMMAIPTGWTIENGTANSPSLTNWSSTWDNVGGGQSWVLMPDTKGDCPANHDCYSIQFTSPWDHDTADENMACNIGGTVCDGGSAGTDQDGVANRMGIDGVIKTSPGETAGAYTILVYAVGFDGNIKAYKAQTINVTVNEFINTSPDDPTNPAQYRSDGSTIISSGGYTEESTVKIEADISDPDGADTVKLQVDIDSNGSSDCESALVANPSTNVQVSCTVSDGISYNWQVRTVDNNGANSSWVAFAGSPDFTVDQTAPTGLSNASPANGATDQSTSVNVVANTATDSGSGSVQYYFEVAEDSGFSTGLQQSGWQAGTSYAPTLSGSMTYYWHVKARDALGNETSYTTTWSFTTAAAALSSGPNSAGASSNNASYGSKSWSGGDVTASNNSYVTASNLQNSSSNYLVATNFGFAIPGGATINGILVEIERKCDNSNACQDDRVRIVKGGTIQSTDRATAAFWPTTDAYASYGGISDLWGTTWTAANINASTFGVALSAKVNGTKSSVYADHIRITVYYTPSSNTNPDDPTNLAQYRSNGSTAISSGGYTEESTVKIEADISDPDGGDTVKLQVDIDSNGSSDCESALVANPGTNVQVSCSVSNGTSYNWQVRTVDNNGTNSSWVAFAGTPDFISDQSAPTTSDNTPAAWQSNEITVTLTPNDGTGSGVTAATGIYGCFGTGCSPLVLGGNTMTTICGPGNACTYNVRYYSVDNVGNTESTKTSANQARVDRQAPAAPTGFNASDAASGGQCDISWNGDATDGSGSGLNSSAAFKVYYQSGAVAPACGGGTEGCSEASGSTSCSVNTLTDDQQYSFRLCVYDNLNNETSDGTSSCTPTSASVGSNLTVISNTLIASSATAGDTDVQMQRLEVSCGSAGDGICVITSVTVDDLGTAAGADIDNLKIHMDSDSNFGNGTLGSVTDASFDGTSTVVDMTSIDIGQRTVSNAQNRFIWILYDLNSGAGGKDIRSSVTAIGVAAPDNGTSGTWNSSLFTISAVCTRTDPTVTLGSNQKIDVSESVIYTISILNNDNVVCGDTTYNVSILSEIESSVGSFTLPSALSSGPPCVASNLSPGNSDTSCTLTVTGSGSGSLSDTLDTTVRTSSGNHNNVDTAVTTTIANPFMHNSINLSSTKWVGSGGWGITGAKYGAFTCETCHTDTTTNIKRINTSITAPNSPTDDFPGSAVTFTDPRDTSSDFGDDASAHATSQKICEVCHTYDATQTNGVKFHAYDMSAGGADLTHYNQTNCISCHKHNTGFKPSACDGCHGNPPINTSSGGPDGLANDPGTTGSATAGAHATHVTTLGIACTACHYNYTMPDAPDQDIDIGFSMFGLDGTGTTYNGQLTVNSYTGHNSTIVTSTGSAGGNDLNCSGLYCHGSTLTAGTNTSPYWDGLGTVTCGTCHGENTVNPPTAGSHERHAGNASGELSMPCTDCHGGTSGAQGHVDGNVSWTLNTGDNKFGAGATYNGGASGSSGSTAPSSSYGSCSTVYCHSTVQADGGSGAPAYNTPQWGSGALTCATNCHTGDPGTGAHDTHLTQTDRSGVECGTCHTGAGDGTSSPTSNHADYSINVAEGTYTSGGAPRNGYGSCSTSACHNDGTGTTVITPAWDQTIACDDCHATNMATLSHDEHLGSAEMTIGCGDCHTGAVQGTTKPTSNHNDGNNNADNTYSQDAQTYDAVYGTCSTAACHNDGTGTPVVTPVWGQTIACDGCHATNMATLSHDEHLGSTERTIGCGDCHAGAVQGTTKPTSNHNDGKNNADNAYTQNAQTYDAVYGTCSTAACHNDGTGTPVVTSVWGQPIACNGCHATTAAALNTGSHYAHMNTSLQTVGCGDCHTGAVENATKPTNNHNNGLNNVDAGSYNGGGAYGNGYGSCSTAACHGTATWGGGALGCDVCHLGTGDTDNFSWDETKAVVDSTDWSSVGHGGFGTANLSCTDCHSSGVNHNVASNYFRLSDQTNTLCMSCHNSVQGGTPAVDGSEHYGGNHSATDNGGKLCWDCHDPHGDGPIKMIHDKPWMRRDANGIPTRIADDTTVLFTTTGTEGSYVRADLRGVCQICHDQATTITKYFRYNSYPTVAGGGSSGGYDTGHSGGSPCTDCHAHSAWQGSGDCTTCHNGIPGTSYVSRDVVGSDFTKSSRHVFGGTVTNWDCIVCHREGDAIQAGAGSVSLTSLHKNSGGYVVDMRNVDSINTGWVWDKNNITNAMHTDMDSFCMSCHDSDSSRGAGLGGAGGIAVNSADTGVTLSPTLNERMKPFNSTDAVDAGTGGGTANVSGYARTAVLDVYKQFDTANPSHHAVRGTAYSSHNANWGNTAWVSRTLKSGQALTTVYEAAQLHCADCHTVDQNAHGGSNGFMLQAPSIDGTCYLCHNSATYSNNSSTHTRWDHSNDGGVWDTADGSKVGQYGANEGSICLNCHGGNPVTDGFGGIHGLPSGTDPRSGQERYRFIGGSYMSHSPSSWTGTSGGTPTCYFDSGSDTQPWSNCTQHGGSGNETEVNRTDVPQYSRGVPGDY